MFSLRFRMGAHSLPVVLCRRTGAPVAQRLCQRWGQHAVGDGAPDTVYSARCARHVCCLLLGMCLHHATVHVASGHDWCLARFSLDCFNMLDAQS